MPTATSNFLQGTNAANAAQGAPSTANQGAAAPLDETHILAAVNDPSVTDVNSLANQLGVAAGAVGPEVERLCKQGLVEDIGSDLKLSDAGERALRYADLAGL